MNYLLGNGYGLPDGPSKARLASFAGWDLLSQHPKLARLSLIQDLVIASGSRT